MGWFIDWWQGLGLAGQILACAAIPMSVVMLLQLILMLIGIGPGSESDSDTDDGVIDVKVGTDLKVGTDHPAHESGHSNNSIWRIFTIRGIVAFFALGGWAGLAALTAGIPVIWAIQIAVLAGVAALLLASIAIRLALRMQDSGNISLQNAIAQIADVYITIPPSRSNIGKVTMLLQERFVEVDAMTDSETEIRPGSKVEVVDLAHKDCLVVRPVNEEIEETK